jgi:hypothetical protein
MFDVWKLNRQLQKIQKSFAKEHQKLVKRKAPAEDFQNLDYDEHYAIEDAEKAIDLTVGTRLFHEARSLDVETPPFTDEEMWFKDDENDRIWFTSKGRAHVRRLIDEEKARRFEVKTRWVMKIILPVMTALIGIIGAVTGLVAVLGHKK